MKTEKIVQQLKIKAREYQQSSSHDAEFFAAVAEEITEMEKHNQDTKKQFDALNMQIESLKACIGAGATFNEVIDILASIPSDESAIRELQAETIRNLKFPIMFRKMWYGGEVQHWIDEQGNALRR